MKSFIRILVILLLLSPFTLKAQTAQGRFYSKGGLVGYGPSFSDNTTYNVFFFMGDYSQSWKKQPVKKDFTAWYAAPQFNLVKAFYKEENHHDIEFGVNLGFRNYIRISDNFYLYQQLGSGPHYITAKLERQATGFIFSDNLDLGSFIQLDNKLFLNLQFGIRHISNANLQLPNRGVNSYVFMAGLSGLGHKKKQ
jgi:hypothetical protein